MYLAGRWAHRQLSRIEMIFVVIVLCLLLSFFLQYMLKMFAVAERTLMTTSVVNINTALKYRAAAFALNGNYSMIEAMQGMNPFNMDEVVPRVEINSGLETNSLIEMVEQAGMLTPANYFGEINESEVGTLGGGIWYFDLSNRTLVYRVDNAEYFESDTPGAPRAIFSVVLDYLDQNGNNRFDPLVDRFRDVKLQASNKYGWQL